jgi:tRNA A37 threonylcarbamoyladenosine synthetase subunit TsaC/SUA5/YrdC
LVLLVLVTALGSDAAFLQNQLPLEVVLTTPSALLDNSTQSIKVEEGQAFMVSRAPQRRFLLELLCQLGSCCTCPTANEQQGHIITSHEASPGLLTVLLTPMIIVMHTLQSMVA